MKIVSETGVAAGVRRIEALTSKGLMKYYDADWKKNLKNAAALLKATPDNLAEKIHSYAGREQGIAQRGGKSERASLLKDACRRCDWIR